MDKSHVQSFLQHYCMTVQDTSSVLYDHGNDNGIVVIVKQTQMNSWPAVWSQSITEKLNQPRRSSLIHLYFTDVLKSSRKLEKQTANSEQRTDTPNCLPSTYRTVSSITVQILNTHYLQNLRCRKSNPPKIDSFVICRPKTASFFEPGCKSKLDNYSLPSTLLPGKGDNRGSLQFRYFARVNVDT